MNIEIIENGKNSTRNKKKEKKIQISFYFLVISSNLPRREVALKRN